MITRDNFQHMLDHKTILLTGAGGGIGVEAALAFAAMGARVILAEIDPVSGKATEDAVRAAYPNAPATFYQVDLSEETQVRAMADWVLQNFGAPDVVFNNATITKMGAVDQMDVSFWDKSYRVNLKAPVLLSQLFLPHMKTRNSGALVFVSSSGASPYMGAYEVFKTAQVELSNTLAMELEDTNISVFTIGPGLVKTQTAMNPIEIVSASMGMSLDAFYEMNSNHILAADAAGLGFALSAAHAERYRGQEIGCIQVLMDNGFYAEESGMPDARSDAAGTLALLLPIQKTFQEQYDGWQKMNLFERQWVFRDFKKAMGLSAEQALETLQRISDSLRDGLYDEKQSGAFLANLKRYWQHQLKLMQGYEKNPAKLEEHSRIIESWINDIQKFLEA